MKYVCLVYGPEDAMRTVNDAECKAYSTGLVENQFLLAAEALEPVDTATTLRLRDSKLSITDGPFAETKEQLAGFYLLDARDLNHAIQLASGIPPVRIGSIEIRPVRELQVPPEQ